MKVQEELKAYIDGELKPEEAMQVQEQVEASSELAQEVAFLKLLGQEIREMVHEPSVDGATETLEAVAKHPRMSRWRIWGGAFGLAATLILIAQLPGMLAQAKSADQSTSRSVAMANRSEMGPEGGIHDDVRVDGVSPSSAAKAAAPMAAQDPTTTVGARAGIPRGSFGRSGGFPVNGRLPALGGSAVNGSVEIKKEDAGESAYFISSRQQARAGRAPAPKPVTGTNPIDTDTTNGTPTVNGSVYASQNGLVIGKQEAPSVADYYNHHAPVGQLQASPKPQSSSGSSGFNPIDKAKALQGAPAQPARMVIQNGTLDLYVANVTESQNRAINLAKGVGGFVANSSFSGGNPDAEDDTPSAQIELRVPVMQFTNVMARLRGFAVTPKDIKSDQVSGNDVTAQYADDEGRLRELHAEENDYVEMLKKVRHMDDILSLKDRLSSVRQDISGYESQVATLKDQSAMSTIDLTLETKTKPKAPAPKPKPKGWAESTWDSAEATRSDALKTIAGLGIFLVAWSPIWLPIGIGAWWVTRKTR